MLLCAWRLRSFPHLFPAVVLEELFIVAASTQPSVQVFVIHDHSLWRWLHCWRSADTHKLAHQFYCHFCLNTFQTDFFFCCSQAGGFNLSLWAPDDNFLPLKKKNDRPGAFDIPHSLAPLLHFLTVFDAFSLCHTDMFSIVDSSLCCPNAITTLTYSAVLLLSPSLCMLPRKYAVTFSIWQMSAKTKACTWTDTSPITQWRAWSTSPTLGMRTCKGGEQLEIKQMCGECVCVLVWHICVERHEGVPDRYGLSESPFLLCSVTLRLLPHACLPLPAWRSGIR